MKVATFVQGLLRLTHYLARNGFPQPLSSLAATAKLQFERLAGSSVDLPGTLRVQAAPMQVHIERVVVRSVHLNVSFAPAEWRGGPEPQPAQGVQRGPR